MLTFVISLLLFAGVMALTLAVMTWLFNTEVRHRKFVIPFGLTRAFMLTLINVFAFFAGLFSVRARIFAASSFDTKSSGAATSVFLLKHLMSLRATVNSATQFGLMAPCTALPLAAGGVGA